MSEHLPPAATPPVDPPKATPPAQQEKAAPKWHAPDLKPILKPVLAVFRRVWFWIIVVVVIVVIVVIATQCGRSPGNNPTGPVTTATSTPTTNQPTAPAPAPAARDNSGAKAVTLGIGPAVVGTDVEPGRYRITPGKNQTGTFSVQSSTDPMIINEVLGVDTKNALGVPSVTTDLATGDLISISGIHNVTFTPVATELSDTLSAGNWVVGLDIEPGSYTVTTTSEYTGSVFVLDSTGALTTTQTIGGTAVTTSFDVTLNNSDQIKIMGLAEVNFAKA